MTTETWLSAARREIDRLNLDPELYQVLLSFGGENHAPGPSSLDADADDGTATRSFLPSRIGELLSSEVDSHQASMFGRRFDSVSTLLSSRGTPTSDLLRLGLHRRAAQILDVDPPPRALRIRALVDFVWSQSMVLDGPDRSAEPTLEELASRLVTEDVGHGVEYGLISGPSREGPVHVNVLRIPPRAVRVVAVDARSETTDLPSLAAKRGAIAAISGGFFLYSEPDIAEPSRRTDPVGLLATDGVVKGPPVFARASLLQDANRKVMIKKVGMDGAVITIGVATEERTWTEQNVIKWKHRFVVGQNKARIVNRCDANVVTLDYGERGIAIVGTDVVRDEIEGMNQRLDVPLNGFVLVVPLRPTAPIRKGHVVSYTLPDHPHLTSGMAGGPLLLGNENEFPLDLPREDFRGMAPPVTFSQDETFDRNLLPRMGVGLGNRGELVVVAVDGRNLDQALGLTLRGTARLLKALGCVRAMNLDGGSSKRMVVRGKVVDLSTTEVVANNNDNNVGNGSNNNKKKTSEPARPVHSAILFLPPEKAKN